MSDWIRWIRGHGKPREAIGAIDVKYLDGKEFIHKPIENCYWGDDSLIEYWRPHQATPTEQRHPGGRHGPHLRILDGQGR